MAAKETAPRGVSYYCVPVCHSYSDKVADGKTVRLNNLQRIVKQERLGLLGSEVCVKIFCKAWNKGVQLTF